MKLFKPMKPFKKMKPFKVWRQLAAIFSCAFIMLSLLALPASAAEGDPVPDMYFSVAGNLQRLDTTIGPSTGIDEVDNMFNNVIDLFSGVVKFAGIFVCLFGIVQIGMSISSHDASQRVNGFLFMAAGVIIFFAPDIVSAIAG